MKAGRVLVILALGIVVLLVLGLGVAAQGPGGTWVSGIQIQNQSDAYTTTITIEFFRTDGTVAKVFTDTIAAGKSKTYYVPAHIPGLEDDFIGSAVVSSSQPVAAILNTQEDSPGTEAEPKRLGSAIGVAEPATEAFAPYLRKGYYGRNSYMAVQNTSGSEATVYVSYRDGSGAALPTAGETAVVPEYSTKIFYQDASANLPSGFYGSAVITSTAPLAVVVNNANESTSYQTSGFESYNGFSSGAAKTKLYLPKLTINYYGYQTGFQIQNAGTVAATMAMSYTFGSTSYYKTSPSIEPGAAWSVYLANYPKSGLPEGLSGPGAAIVTSGQPMVGVVIENKSDLGYSAISSAVPDGSGSSTVLFPKFDRTYYDYNGGIQVQNLGTVATTLQATFSLAGRTDVTVTSDPVPPGGSAYWYGPNVSGLTEAFYGSVVVISLEDQPIAGVYTSKNGVKKGDSYTAYNGIQKE